MLVHKYNLRASVSMVPTSDPLIYDFFQGNTRRIRRIRFIDRVLADIIANLDGATVTDILATYSTNKRVQTNIEVLLKALYDCCLIENTSVAEKIHNSQNYRLLNFLADYIPSHLLFSAYEKLVRSRVLIVGVGGIGSWIALGLAQVGVSYLILCDPDNVKIDNLNRSLFFWEDIGTRKIEAMRQRISEMNPQTTVEIHDQFIESETQFMKLINNHDNRVDLVINAADMPNVDTTSSVIAKICTQFKLPHIIAGGYNLHLSIIGPTIIPFESACYKCIEIGLNETSPINLTGLRKLEREHRNIGNVMPLAGISASFTLNEAIRVLIKSERFLPQMLNKRGEFNFHSSTMNFTEFSRRKDCPWCSESNVTNPT